MPRLGWVAAAGCGKVYAVGMAAVSMVDEYDPATNAWATKAPMPTVREHFGLTTAGNGRLYTAGGIDASVADPRAMTAATLEEYTP